MLTRLEAEKRWAHARQCNKRLDECLVCQGNVQAFGALPPVVLSEMLAERLAPVLRGPARWDVTRMVAP